MIELLAVSGPTTIQDLGRHGQYRYGVGTAGAMDDIALSAGNLLNGNDAGAAGIEIAIAPLRLRFLADMPFALTGADADATLGTRPLLPWSRTMARAGDILTVRRITRGALLYLTVAGGIDVPSVLGSRSTQLRGEFGGLDGRVLREGDQLPCGGPNASLPLRDLGIEPPEFALARMTDRADATVLRVVVAGEYDGFDLPTQARFWDSAWKVTPQSNRYGYRLEGPAVLPRTPIEKRSHGIVPGVIQIPPGGQPIIQVRDAQTSGGYPKIGTVIAADLWRLGQTRLGSALRFVRVSYEEALTASDEVQAYLSRLTAVLAQYREY
jgi:biotin-dependent carboxylase-like uncharacterized protein